MHTTAFARILVLLAMLLLLLMAVGAATRLTDSGLSMTTWKPLGYLPPHNSETWQKNLDNYRASPEGKIINKSITLAEFKQIFWWEYAHRTLARVLGVFLLGSIIVLNARRKITRKQSLFLFLLLCIVTIQGLLGWLMVKSGLHAEPRVSPYLLAIHLTIALSLLLLICARLLGEVKTKKRSIVVSKYSQATCFAIAALALITFVSGAFIAGLDAGSIHNDWPTMSGKFIPTDYRSLDSYITNAFENPAAAQFHHRVLGTLLLIASIILFLNLRANQRNYQALITHARLLIILPSCQVLLGIITLRLQVPLFFGLAHHLCAIAVVVCSCLLPLRLVSRKVGQ